MNEEKIKQINKMTREDILHLEEFKELRPFIYQGRENAVSLIEYLPNLKDKGINQELINALAKKLELCGDIENGFYIPTENDFNYEVALNSAKDNVLDKRVMDFVRDLESIEEIQDFQSEILDFAKNQKKKTEFSDFIKTAISQLKKRQKEYKQAELMEKYKKQHSDRQSNLPNWAYLDKKDRPRIDERLYIDHLINECGEVRCWNSKLRTIEDLFCDGEALNMIQNEISQVINYKIANTACDILKALKNRCYCEEPKPDRESIHFPNGTLKVDDKGLFTVFSEQKEFCRNRLATNYNFNAPEPKLFLKYLDDLYTPEQIVIIQQFLGYCLIPTNALGITVHIYGRADSGKSRLAFIMMNILGKQNAIMSKISKLGERFGGANVEGKLMYIDEDTSETALANTQVYKTLVTIGDNTPIDLEAKNKQKNIFIPYARFLTFGNFVIQSLYDHTQGFYRRMIILECKPAPKERKKIANLDSLIYKKEGEGVLKWCIDGLNQLIKNDWKLPLTDELIKHSNELKYESDSVKQFIEEDEHIIKNTPTAKIHTVDLYKGYESYCNNNGLKPVTIQTFTRNIKEYTENTDVKYSTNVVIDTKRARGFIGLSYFS